MNTSKIKGSESWSLEPHQSATCFNFLEYSNKNTQREHVLLSSIVHTLGRILIEYSWMLSSHFKAVGQRKNKEFSYLHEHWICPQIYSIQNGGVTDTVKFVIMGTNVTVQAQIGSTPER